METVKENLDNTDIESASETKQSTPIVRLLRRFHLLANLMSRILALPLLLLVLIYQKTLSPDHGMLKPWFPHGYCRFYPSCSQYTAIVLERQGVLGLLKIIKRLISCRPGVTPAVDLPPHQ